MTAPADLTERFLLENLDIRGQVVRLGPLWRAIVSRRDYPDELLGLLGEFAALAVLIGSGLKHPGRAVLQVLGQGPISLAVADCTRELALRAMVKAGGKSAGASLHEWFPTGRLVLTIENAQTARHFQSIVPLEGATLAECFERYFDRSEQVPTHLWVHASGRPHPAEAPQGRREGRERLGARGRASSSSPRNELPSPSGEEAGVRGHPSTSQPFSPPSSPRTTCASSSRSP